MSSWKYQGFSICWKLKNFSFLDQIDKKKCEHDGNPTYTLYSLERSKWTFLIYPRGLKFIYDKIYLSCLLQDIVVNAEDITLQYRLNLYDIFANNLATKQKHGRIFKSNDGWGFIEVLEPGSNNKDLSQEALTISCDIKKLHDELPTGYNSFIKLLADRLAFQWSVFINPDYSGWDAENVFQFAENCHFKVELTAPEDDILISIQITNEKLFEPRVVKCKVSFLNITKTEEYSKTASHFFIPDENNWKFPSFIKKSEMRIKEGFYIFLFEFSVLMEDTLKIYNVKNPAHVFDSPCKTRDSPQCDSLRDDFLNLYNSQNHSDIKLKVNDTFYLAHKTVLVARSEVLSTLFNQSKKQNGVVKIDDVDAEAFKFFLKFMYTDIIENLDYKIALKLLIIALRYQVLSLAEKCVLLLTSSLTPANVCEILETANKIQHQNLKSIGINYVKTNSKEILSTPKWCEWVVRNQELAMEIFAVLSNETNFTE